jgi:hypothetical protein
MAYHHNPRVVTNGLVLYMDAGNPKSYSGSGTVWNDLSVNRNNANLINGTGYSSNNNGYLVFDGVNDNVRTLNNTGISSSNSRSMCVWVYPTELTSGLFYSVAKIGSANFASLFELMLIENFITGHFWGNGQAVLTDSNKILLNNFTYVVMTLDGNTISIYVDGNLKSQSTFTLSTTNSVLTLGQLTFGSHRNFRGNVPSIKLYNRALSNTEILQNYNATKSRFGI